MNTTQEALKAAFIKLYTKKPYEKITIKELCLAALRQYPSPSPEQIYRPSAGSLSLVRRIWGILELILTGFSYQPLSPVEKQIFLLFL